jgi:hypothetical protein
MIAHGHPKTRDFYNGEWEIGSFGGPWRLSRGATILLESQDSGSSISQLDARLRDIQLGSIKCVSYLSAAEIRVELDNEISVDFLAPDEDGEGFHIFAPGRKYIEFVSPNRWNISDSSRPMGS